MRFAGRNTPALSRQIPKKARRGNYADADAGGCIGGAYESRNDVSNDDGRRGIVRVNSGIGLHCQCDYKHGNYAVFAINCILPLLAITYFG